MFPALPWIAVVVVLPALVSLSYPIHLAFTLAHRPKWKPRRTPPCIGIVVPTCGAEDGLRENVAALIAQRAPGGVQVVFVAEDREDAGLAVARSLAAGDEHIRMVVSGPAGADLGKG